MGRPPDKILVVCIDGIGDVSVPDLGGLTPLQCARTPFLDALAAAGLNGLMDPVEPGLACGSDTAHLSMLGYPPKTYYRGRGSFESMGAGLPMEPGDIAFKCNFATVDVASGIVVHRRADRHFENLGPVLCDSINLSPLPSFPEHQVLVKYATEHRCGVCLRGPNLTDAITGTDPLVDGRPLIESEPLDQSPAAIMTSQLVNEVSRVFHDTLSKHWINADRVSRGKPPANIVLLRGPGGRITAPTFEERHGLRAFMIAPTAIIAGLGMSLAIDIIKAPGATGDYFTNLPSKAVTAVAALTAPDSEYDFGFLHVKAVDDAGHDKNVQKKVEFLERADSMIGDAIEGLAMAEDLLRHTFVVCVTGDHSTPVLYGDHSHEPVPWVVARVSDVHRRLADHRATVGPSTPLHPGPGPELSRPPPLVSGSPLFHPNSTQAPPAPESAAASPSIPGPSPGTCEEEAVDAATVPAGTGTGTVRWDAVTAFSEVHASQGALGRFPGSQMMHIIKSFAGRTQHAASSETQRREC